LFSSPRARAPRDLPSFPTRRSSDLGRAGVFGLDADRVHVPGHARVGAGTGVPGTPGGDDVPRAIPAKAEVAQRTRKVRAAVGHDALRRVVALRAGRSRRVVPDDAPGGVHAAVAPGFPTRHLD